MSKLVQASLTIGLFCLLSGLLSAANNTPGSYLIKPRPVRDFIDALGELRRFLSNQLSPEQRCQRQAVVLNTMNKAPINQYEIADIAIARKEEIEKRYSQINVELLRNLYITASRQYLERQLVDNALIELLGCLKSGYRNRDVRARSFLNERELNEVIDQFQAISQQPIKLLINGNTHQTGLNLHKFHNTIKRVFNNWIGDDRHKTDRSFKTHPAYKPQQQHQHEPPHTNKPLGLEGEEPFQVPMFGPSLPNQHVLTPADDGTAFAMAGANPPPSVPPLPMVANSIETSEDDDQEYLETIFGSLMAVYESLPRQAQLADRCDTYNRVIAAKRQQLFREGFVDKLINQASSRILYQGSRRGVFRPDKKTREDFLFVVGAFNPLRAGPEVWLDLNECLSKWVNVDQAVAQYLNSPEHVVLVNQVNAQFEVETEPPYGQPETAFY